MIARRSKAALAGLLLSGAALAIGIPAFGQKAPESLLPPGFGDAPVPPVPQPTKPASDGPVDLLPSVALAPPAADATPDDGEVADDDTVPDTLETPKDARRMVDVVGPLEGDHPGLGAGAWGNESGRFLGGLMRRIDAPIASRWESMLLRRALLTQVRVPRGVDPVDWVAERAWLLLRMGEADGARMLVQSVDVDRFTPRMYAVAAQTALATADPAALCPLVPGAAAVSQEPIWPMARAMCAALSGEGAVSTALIDNVRRSRVAGGIDLLLATKIVGAGANGRRAVNIEWDGVERLTAWRFGLATATNVAVPDDLFATVGPHVQAWRARAAMIAPAQRLYAARVAAAIGVFSSAALADLYASAADGMDDGEVAASDSGRLREAFAGDDGGARMKAMRAIWNEAGNERDGYARAILTARAAAALPVSADRADEARGLIASMMTAGLDISAERWANVVAGMSASDADPAWAILAVGTPSPAVDIGYSRVSSFADRAGTAGTHKAQMLVAALAGLGRLTTRDAERLATDLKLPIGQRDRWTDALDHASANGEQGTVALLVAAGMQTRSWHAVPPRYFYRMIAALERVGLDGAARMMAAEAMSRL